MNIQYSAKAIVVTATTTLLLLTTAPTAAASPSLKDVCIGQTWPPAGSLITEVCQVVAVETEAVETEAAETEAAEAAELDEEVMALAGENTAGSSVSERAGSGCWAVKALQGVFKRAQERAAGDR